jgi:hypothetical protein
MNKTRGIILLSALACAAALALTNASAQKGGWQGKPYKQWTLKDAEELLADSPWAQTKVANGQVVDPGGFSPISGMNLPGDGITLRLRSSLAIRLAMLRVRQLRANYDQMSDKKKAEFDEKNKPLVECPACAANYVVSLNPPPGRDEGVATSFNSMSQEQVKHYVRFMNDSGETRELVHFEPSKVRGGESLFFFPRLNRNGEPLLTPATKKLVIILDEKMLGVGGSSINRFEFDVSKMVADDGQVAF